MLYVLALGLATYPSPPLDATPRPLPRAATPTPSTAAAPATELGGVIHFPAKLTDSGWPETEQALDRLKLTLGSRAYVRWDALWHETNWDPDRPLGYDRLRHIVDLLGSRGLRSLMLVLPHPWPGSVWDSGPTSRDWGAPKPEWSLQIAVRYREAILAYRDELRVNGMAESANAVQWGNEPASGHPGGDATLPRGTWSGHAFWTELNRDPSFYGGLQVVAPALSMLDESASAVEVATSAVPNGQDWTVPVDRRAMHFRFYKPDAGTVDGYAQAYVHELKRRSALVLAQSWPQGTATKQASRREGLWVTEGYVASGDAPEPRGDAWRRVLTRIRAGVPGVRVFIAYRFYPSGGPDGLDWQIPLDAQRAISRR